MLNQPIKANASNRNVSPTVHMVQGDNGRRLVCDVLDYDIPTDAIVNFSFVRPDGNVYTRTGTVSGNRVSATITSTMLNVAGKAKGTFHIYSESADITVSTFIVTIIVEESAGFNLSPSSTDNNVYAYVNGNLVRVATYANMNDTINSFKEDIANIIGTSYISTRTSSGVNYINVNTLMDVKKGQVINVKAIVSNTNTYEYTRIRLLGIYSSSDTSSFDELIPDIKDGIWREATALANYELIRVVVLYPGAIPEGAVNASTNVIVSDTKLYANAYEVDDLSNKVQLLKNDMNDIVGDLYKSSKTSSGVNYINIDTRANINEKQWINLKFSVQNQSLYPYVHVRLLGIYSADDRTRYDILLREIIDEKWYEVQAISSYEMLRVQINYSSLVPAETVTADSNIVIRETRLYSSIPYSESMNNNYNLFEPMKLRFAAHRGARLEAPENSLPAIRIAGEQKYDWLWIARARQSADGTWYVMHDSTIDRTTNGTGDISTLTDAYLSTVRIDVGANIEQYSQDELKILTLSEAIKEAYKYGMNIGIGDGSLTSDSDHNAWLSFVHTLKECGADNCIMYGTIAQINALKCVSPNWHGCVYVDSENKEDVISAIEECHTRNWTNISILADYDATDASIVKLAHSYGFKYICGSVPGESNPTDANATKYKRLLEDMMVDICQSAYIHN